MPDTTELLGAERPSLEKRTVRDLQTPAAVNIITRRALGSCAPLSFGQQQLWFLAQLTPDTPLYNECVATHLSGSLDVAALEQSLNEIIKRHEAWRTSFPMVDRQPFQRLMLGLMRRIGSLLRLGQDKQLDWYLRLRHMFNYLRSSRYRNSKGLSLVPAAEALRQQNWVSIFDWIALDYVRRPYAGKITFLWCSEAPLRLRKAWRKVAKKAKEVENHIVPGTPISIRTDHLRILSAYLSRCLDEAQASK
jgi:hypothetical protein